MGLMIAVHFSTDASPVGIALVLLASLSSALRWVLLQWLILIDLASSNVMVAIYRFTPSSTLFLLPLAIIVELPRFLDSHFASSSLLTAEAVGIGCSGASVQHALIGFEIFIVKITSSVTLGILGQAKEIAQIALSMLIYKETMTTRTAAGLCISLIAANVYKSIKQNENRDENDEGNLEKQQTIKGGDLDPGGGSASTVCLAAEGTMGWLWILTTMTSERGLTPGISCRPIGICLFV